MAGTLLIVGLTLFLLGSVALAREAGTRGHSWILLLIPFASARFVQNSWSDVWLAALARVLGFALILAAAGITVARDPLVLENPARLFGAERAPAIAGSKRADMNSFVNSAEAIQIAIRNDDNEKLSGRIHGQSFLYDRVELIDGLLAARQGSGFLPDLELRIVLNQDFSGLERRRTLYVQPGDENPPVVHLSWKDERGDLQTEIIRSGYRMELQLAPLTQHQLSGFLQIILPDARQSFLSGEFVAYTNRLRYQGDRVDLTFDHGDTLEYVAEQYLHTQYPEGAVRRIIFTDTNMKLSRDLGSTTATVTLSSGRIERRVIPLERSEIGWAVVPSGVEITVVQKEQNGGGTLPLSGPESGPADGMLDSREDAPRETVRSVSFEQLAKHVGEQVVTTRRDGKQQEGILRQVGDERIQVEAMLGGGTVRYQVRRDQLASVRLVTKNTLLRLSPEEGAPDGREPAEEPEEQPVPEPETGAAPVETGAETSPADDDTEQAPPSLEKLQGRTVEIVDNTGRTRTGLLKSVTADQITLTVQMGAGSVDYYYKPAEIRSVEVAGKP